ncbi:MAG: SDR family NAD(P)-dependent oxidoreductase [Anaerolineae bacterium]
MVEGKTAVVTGAGSGIGQAVALRLAADGANVVVADIDAQKADETRAIIEEHGGSASAVETDVADEAAVAEMIAGALDRYGGLDIAVNNAGIVGELAPIHESSTENWHRVLGINLHGVYYCMKYELRPMLEAGSGSIVNIASMSGLVGTENVAQYVAAKHGVVGLTKTAALEYATSGVRVNAVCPAMVHTPLIDSYAQGNEDVLNVYRAMQPMQRMGTPEEIANLVAWLASDESTFMTGAALNIDGGQMSR